MLSRYKILCEVYDKVPLDDVPYRNKWGHWVWVEEGSYQDPSSFGTKAPKRDAVPKVVYDRWQWVMEYED